jgi:CDP-diacylglycerol---glycerol-3-phosphate 3-phosphatidyltransferase
MDRETDTGTMNNLHRLRWEWGGYVLASVSFLLASFFLLRQFWGAGFALRWLVVAGAISIYQFAYLFFHLKENHLKSGSGNLFPTLGLANWITITRAIFNAALAGFLLGPWPTGWLAWVPSILYLVSSLMDFTDGIAARLTGRTTLLGENLDMNWDGVGVLIASFLSVLYGQTPAAYLLVGLARYLFLIGQWLRTRQGLPLNDLLPSRIRRPFAGAQMMFLAVVLMPLYTPPATHVVAWLFMLPFLVNFFRDWLVVSGVTRQVNPQRSLFPRFLQLNLPLAVRGGLIWLLVELIVHVLNQQPLDWLVLIISAIAIPSLLLGAAGRVSSLAVLLVTGFGLQLYPLEWRFWAILLFSAISMMIGTGRFSLWKPEDWLLFKQAGERHPSVGAQQ